MLNLVAEIDEFKGSWRGLGCIAPDRLARLRRATSIESIGSSIRMDGGTLTDREVERLLARNDTEPVGTRDEQGVVGYSEVLNRILDDWTTIDVTEAEVRALHKDILRYATEDEQGHPCQLMGDLIGRTEASLQRGEVHPLLVIAVFHVILAVMRPFQHGNGRLLCILTTLLLLRAGYAYVPYSSLERVIEQNRDTYELVLGRAKRMIMSDRPDWQPWVSYFLNVLRQQKIRLETIIDREWVVFRDLPDLSVQILELARGQGRVTIASATKLTGVSRNTIKEHVRTLVAKGLLIRHGAGRGTSYSSSRLVAT